ncbi:MAG: DUF2939 domain-containing protein [Gammaproteobacteria bacterium]|nr:DUF2939 domain-containing protein [Gammaproteobacteria bacterium]
MQSPGRRRAQAALWRRPLQLPRSLRRLAATVAVVAGLYLISPYWMLWELNRTVVNGPTAALGPMVAIESVRDQVQRRLNKEQESCIGEVSDAFIDWIQQSIRRHRGDPLTRSIDLAWLRKRLLTHSRGDKGFWPALEYAFYMSPTRFRVRIGPKASETEPADDVSAPAVSLCLDRSWLRWRVIAVSY